MFFVTIFFISPIIGGVIGVTYNYFLNQSISIGRFMFAGIIMSTILFFTLLFSKYNVEKKTVKGYDILCEQECVNVFSSSNQDLVVFRYTDNVKTYNKTISMEQVTININPASKALFFEQGKFFTGITGKFFGDFNTDKGFYCKEVIISVPSEDMIVYK